MVGVRPEHSIDPTSVEPKVVEPLLQHEHVVASGHMGGRVGQDPVAQLPAGFL